jgi:predicted amidohydrolase
MKAIHIHSGHVVDPSINESGVRDLWIVNGRVAELPTGYAGDVSHSADQSGVDVTVIDASGHFVFPGLVDYHLHFFHGGTENGVQPDSALFPQGVTTGVDQGSSGVANYEAFHRGILAATVIRAYAYLNLCSAGLVTARYAENVDPRFFDRVAIRETLAKYDKVLRGVKIRQSVEIAGDFGLRPLEEAIRIADDAGVSVAVHTTDPAGRIEDLASLLRRGDVFSHVYHGRGETILDASGKIRPAIRRARDRGVLFDTADGRTHYEFRIIRDAMEHGFPPDIISTDLTKSSLFATPVFGLPFVMSKYLALGMSLEEVVRATTEAPVRVLGLDGAKHGTLRPGACADVSIFKLKEASLSITDKFGDTVRIQQILVPRMTILEGSIVYRSMEF